MADDASRDERIDLPRFVRDIGVLGPAGSWPRAETGVLSSFDGVLTVGVDHSGGIPPALRYLALPEIVARGMNRGSGRSSSPPDAGSAASSSGSQSADDGATKTVSQVLRSDTDESQDRRRSDAGDSHRGERTTGETGQDPADSTGGTASTTATEPDASGESDRFVEATETSRSTRGGGHGSTSSGPIRNIDRLGAVPGVLGSGDDGSRLTSTVAGPPTVLATASVPGRAESVADPSGRAGEAAPTRPVASDASRPGSNTRTEVATERRPESMDRFGAVDHARGARDGTAAGTRDDSGTALNTPGNGRSLTVASSQPSDRTSNSGGTSGPTDRNAPLSEWSDDRGGSIPRLTVLEGSRSGDSAGGTGAGGSTPSGGRRGRRAGGGRSGDSDRPAGTRAAGAAGAEPRATGPTHADTAPVEGPAAPTSGRRPAPEFPFPRDLSLEGGGPDARFLEEIYRELTKKMRKERQRGWF